ncbi:YqhA family protein [Mariprofundus ferrooxydans]|uniref:YqhA family protein n=1 Tax=Mariprofundus ferrooxydans TaxID=314344 RepID=UPI0003650DC6|nr:YqhA family protein [Mariprofundus ferrooxydans]
MNIIEKHFEKLLWNSRLFILLAVIFGMIGAVILFVVGSVDIYSVAADTVSSYIHHEHPAGFHETIVGSIIGAVDLYLIAVVLLLFSFGLYELFISEIDAAQASESSNVLEIRNLDQLKDKLAKVIVMVLVVSFFKTVLHTTYNGPLEMLYFAFSILALSVALYFLHKGGDHKSHDGPDTDGH